METNKQIQPQNTTVDELCLFSTRLSLGRTSFLLELFKTLLVSSSFLTRVFKSGLLGSKTSTLVAENSVSNKTLDLGSLISLVTVVFKLTTNDELGDIVLLGETEELADVASSLGSKAAGLGGGLVSESGDLLFALPHDHEVQHADISTHDAATDGLSLAFTLRVIQLIIEKKIMTEKSR